MSMLSEPRRRQKWTLNPRGNLWAKDENKLGQKLMEKMGWEQGRGLGAKQDGMLDPISVRKKEDSKGVGFEGHDDTWLAHQDDFQAVLAALNETHKEVTKTEEKCEGEDKDDTKDSEENKASLEKVSKKSKNRIHYHKFTRGKDLSNYSADDLGSIFGTNSSKRKEERKSKSEPVSPSPEEEIVEDDKVNKTETNVLFTVQKGSYQEYFAKKMAKLKAKGMPIYEGEITSGPDDSNGGLIMMGKPEKNSAKKKKDKVPLDIENVGNVEKTKINECDTNNDDTNGTTESTHSEKPKKKRKNKDALKIDESSSTDHNPQETEESMQKKKEKEKIKEREKCRCVSRRY